MHINEFFDMEHHCVHVWCYFVIVVHIKEFTDPDLSLFLKFCVVTLTNIFWFP